MLQSAATILRVMADLTVMAGLAPTFEAAQTLIRAKIDEHAPHALDDPALLGPASPPHCPSCPSTDPARQAALDGLASAFTQIAEHCELLAEPPQARMLRPPQTELRQA